jgi:hypothetical protein
LKKTEKPLSARQDVDNHDILINDDHDSMRTINHARARFFLSTPTPQYSATTDFFPISSLFNMAHD